MATVHHHLECRIHLRDAGLVTQYQQHDFGWGQLGVIQKRAPTVLALDYDAVIVMAGDPVPPTGNYITSSWFTAGTAYPRDQGEWTTKSGHWYNFGPFSHTETYKWWATFEYAPPVGGSPSGLPGAPDPIARRRWIEGFELPADGVAVSRTASRSTQGLGLAMRDWTNVLLTKQPATFIPGLTPSTSWERLYIRPRVFPTTQKVFWRAKMTSFPSAGFALALTPTGQLALFQVDSVSTLTLLGTASRATVLDEWLRIDLLIKVGTGASASLFVNGQPQLAVSGITGEIATAGVTHSSSQLGDISSGPCSLDVDDWLGADWPASAPALATPGVDWMSGSRVALVRPAGFAASNVWTGDWKRLLQSPPPDTTTGVSPLTSSVSSALLAVTTDYDDEVRGDPNGQIGIAALKVGLYNARAGALHGQLGYALAGAAAVLTTLVQTTGYQWNYAFYGPSGLAVGQDVFPLELVHTKPADTNSETVLALQAEVEALGIFGPEDLPAQVSSFDDLVYKGARANIHNAPYPRTPWAQATIPPNAPIVTYTGTYTGDVNGVTLNFKTPIHWWWVRRLAGVGTDGVKWWSSLTAAHRNSEETGYPELMVQGLQDPTFVAETTEGGQETSYQIRIVGAHVSANATGETYAYVAISDPGGRFLLNGGLKHFKGTVAVDTPLIFDTWLPECGFVMKEFGAATGIYYKGPGHAAASISSLGAAETANALSWSTGHLVSQSAFHASGSENFAHALLRREDGNVQDPDSTDPYKEVFQLTSYTGDGSASRTINLAPATGDRPAFALVVPHNGAAIFRDTAHTGTTSTSVTLGANASTGITGGAVDQISVGSALNSNGIVYDVFVIPGEPTACNGGWSCPGPRIPRSPGPGPGPGPIPPNDPPIPPGPTGPTGPTGPGPGGPSPIPPFPIGCNAASTQIVNMALSKVGLSKLVVNLDVEQTVEATMARLLYADVVDQVLSDVPWPIATRTAALTLVDTYHAAFEWHYAYRLPADCVFPRRLIASPRQMALDPAPPPFQLAVDDAGGLVLTNEAAAELEYTFRPTCAAAFPDALFREALTWKLAMALAIPLTRMKDQAVLAQQMYEKTIATARAIVPPGAPGLVPATPTIDTAPASQAANVEAVNLGLVRIGARTIRNLTTDQGREAQAARVVFERELRETLRAFPWAFATAHVRPLVLVGGTPAVRYNDDWQYAYRVPPDLVFARRLVTETGRTYQTQPAEFRLGADAAGALLFCEEEDAGLEYTRRQDGAVAAADALFVDALAWRIAATLAPSLAPVDPTRPEQEGRGPTDPAIPKERPVIGVQTRQRIAANAWQMYELAIARAKVAAANESQPTIDRPDAPWIEGRT